MMTEEAVRAFRSNAVKEVERLIRENGDPESEVAVSAMSVVAVLDAVLQDTEGIDRLLTFAEQFGV